MRKIISSITILTLLLALGGCGKETQSPTETSATNVSVVEVKKGNIESTVNYTGEIAATLSASVSPLASGTVKSINVEVGDFVKEGTVLMTLDSSTYQLSYNQARAAYNSAVAAYNNIKNGSNAQSQISINQSLATAQSAYDNAQSNYDRQKSLFDIGAVSQVALDAAKTQLDNAKIALDSAKASASLTQNVIAPQSEASAKAGVEQAKAALDLAASSIANCTVKAPISGYIAAKNAKIGQIATQGVEAFSIKNPDSLEIEVNVTEAVIGSIEKDSTAKINIKSAKLENIKGKIAAVSEAKNDRTGMYTVKVSVPNDNKKIKVGMVADLKLVTGTAKDVLLIPSDSVLFDDEENYVYVAKDGKAVKKIITTGVSNKKNIEVKKGLKAGEMVITDGKDFITDKNNEIKITSK